MKAKEARVVFMRKVIVILLWVVLVDLANPQPPTYTPAQQVLIDEHVYGGVPSTTQLLVRNGYVCEYDESAKVPMWVAYHVIPDYRDTPRRRGEFSSYRQDPDVANEAANSDYNGLLRNRGFARGHLAPYAVMGGDRDGDNRNAAAGDQDDKETIFQANYMTNIAPQHHYAFNGSGGLWSNLERWIQDELVSIRGLEVWVFAGCIFGPGEHEVVGPNEDIWVPAMFFKIVIQEPLPGEEAPRVLAFLFPHQRSAHGDIQSFLVSVDVVEAMTGLDFFSDLNDDTEEWLEDTDTWEFWNEF